MSSTRFETAFNRVDRVFAWLDGFIARWLPHESNPLAHAGAAANFALVVAVVSGVALLVWYSPSLSLAYSSVAAMGPRTLGGWVRALHRYSSDLAMLFVLLHATRVLFARKFAGARWLPWVSGIALISLVWVIGWTGYWLVWDQPAQQIAVTSIKFLDGLPIFGEPLGRLYVADRTVPSLLFFVVFFTHMLLPLGIAVGLAVHLTRLSRVRLLPRRDVALALTLGLAIASWFVPAAIDAPANMAVKASALTVDAWYLSPLALALRLQSGGLWLAVAGILAFAAGIPWLLGRRRPPATFQAIVEPSRCHACTQCAQDCPFDAITMVDRTDGKRFPSQASVDPAKCVGCGVCAGSCDSEGITLPWFDTQREESRLSDEIAATHARGGPDWVAFVAGDIDNGFAFVSPGRWRERLPGFQVHGVPTASWLRPKFIEHLLKTGIEGVLIIRDARAESAARDGHRWVSARLQGERKPVFRPERAGGSTSWCVLDYDPARPLELVRRAAAFRRRDNPSRAQPEHRGLIASITAGAVLALALGFATIVPSHLRVANPASAKPEFVFSFKVLGDREESTAADGATEAAKPVHMRGRPTAKPQRAPVRVRLTIDGATQERIYRAKGISHDGPALDEWRSLLSAGEHDVVIEVLSGPAAPSRTWSGKVRAQPNRVHVLTFEPDAGFRVE